MPDKPPLQCRLRLKDDLRRRLDIAAHKRGISKAQEIIVRLEKSFEPDPIGELTTTMKQLLALAMQSGGKVDA
jgi:flagellin-specific chaperone FliS